ncbi:MAG: hypothetical protein QX189_00730 [Methylococcales bacterium]
MSFVQRASLALVFVGCVFSQNVKAEWLWCDSVVIKAEFEKLITNNFPKNCRYVTENPNEPQSETIPYQMTHVFENKKGKKEIVHQMDFNLDKQCFKKLTKKLSQLKAKNKLSVRNKIPTHLFLGDKQSDNSIMFYFDATESEIRDVQGERCDSVKSPK